MMTGTLKAESRRLKTVKAINEFSNDRFRYGTMDCCLFAIEVALKVTGNDHGGSFRGKYRTRTEAEKLVSDAGGMAAIVTRTIGEPVDPDQALDGDPILCRYRSQLFDSILGVRLGEHIVLKTANSVVRINLTPDGILGWRA